MRKNKITSTTDKTQEHAKHNRSPLATSSFLETKSLSGIPSSTEIPSPLEIPNLTEIPSSLEIPSLTEFPSPLEIPCLLELHPLPPPVGFEEAAGPLLFRMTNNAMFHIVFEACPEALKALIGALLRLRPEEIISVEVKNPVTYDLSVYSKNFILDLKILLNGNTVLNIEMQVERFDFWRERSLGYLCRAFDNLNRGSEYVETKSAIHVGILDFNLDPDNQEFYSAYYMINERTQKKYSDKLRLSVLQLRQVGNATEEDRTWHLDLWAKFFNAKTWEEVFMVAEKDLNIKNAALTFYRASADEYIRNFCEGVEEGERTLRTLQLELQQKDAAILQKDAAIMQKDDELQRSKDEIQQKDNEIARLLAKLNAIEQQRQ